MSLGTLMQFKRSENNVPIKICAKKFLKPSKIFFSSIFLLFTIFVGKTAILRALFLNNSFCLLQVLVL